MIFKETLEQGGHTMKPTVFISYSQKDMEFVKKLKSDLEAQNIGVTIDIEAAKIGDNLQDFIETAVRENQFTISVISKNSLQSVWVIAESLENFMYEKVEQKKRFLPIFIDRSVFDDAFSLEVARIVKSEIEKLRANSQEAYELGMGTEHFDTKRKRLETLRNNLGTIFNTLRERLSADFSSAEKIAENFPKLVYMIKETMASSAGGQPISGKPGQTAISAAQRQRFQQEYDSLQSQYELSSLKLDRLRKSRQIEANADLLFSLDKKIEAEEEDRKKILARIEEIEAKLK